MKEKDIRNREVFNRYLRLVEEDIKRYFSKPTDFTRINCPACGSKKYEEQFNKMGFRYVSCLDCATLFVNPRPPMDKLMDFYKKTKSSVFWIEDFFKPSAEARREKIFKPRAEYVNSALTLKQDMVIGDMGAGFGLFLEELRKLAPLVRIVAIEPSPQMAEICKEKGLEVIPFAVEEVKGWDRKFDILVAFELLEHLFDPGKFLEKVLSLLAPKGKLLLTTLNGEGFDIQVLWEKSKSLTPPHHLNFFNPDSIVFLLKSKGFLVDSIITPGQLDWDIVEGMIKDEGIGAGRFWEFLAKNATPEAKAELQGWIQRNRLSSHMQIVAHRK